MEDQGQAMTEQEDMDARSELLSYLERVETMLDSAEFKEEPDQLFVANVLEEVKASEFRLACDNHCSRVIEKLLKVSEAEHVASLATSLQPHFSKLVVHRYGSHVMEGLVQAVARLSQQHDRAALASEGAPDAGGEEAEAAAKAVEELRGIFLALSQELAGDVAASATNTYASHVLQTCICVLAGVAPSVGTSRSASSKGYRSNHWKEAAGKAGVVLPVPQEYLDCLHQLADSVLGLEEAKAWTEHRTACGVLSCLVKALHQVSNASRQGTVGLEQRVSTRDPSALTRSSSLRLASSPMRPPCDASVVSVPNCSLVAQIALRVSHSLPSVNCQRVRPSALFWWTHRRAVSTAC